MHRDYASVFRDIHTPGAAINPDYIAHSVALADGRVLTGTLRTEGDRLIVGDTTGTRTVVDRAEVETTSPSSISIMPEGLDTALGPEQPARPADVPADRAAFARRARARRRPAAAPPGGARRGAQRKHRRRKSRSELRIVLAGGPKDHGPGEHDYPLWLQAMVGTACDGPGCRRRDRGRLAGTQAARDGRRASSFIPTIPAGMLAKAAAARSLPRPGRRGRADPLRGRRPRGRRRPWRIASAWRGRAGSRHSATGRSTSTSPTSKHPITRGFEQAPTGRRELLEPGRRRGVGRA